MKKLLLSVSTVLFALSANAQCTELFISEYVEGSNNNKALEIYNPTGVAIDLSAFRLIRWDNGNTTSDQDVRYVQPLTGTIQPYDTWTCFLDRRNASATGADTILWAEMLTKANALVAANKAAFYSPDYNASTQGARCLPFNGDDAFSLQKNNAGTWSNVDIFGVIGEQPKNGSGTNSPTGGWTDQPNYHNGVGTYWSQNHTLLRKQTVKQGVTAVGIPYNVPGDFNPSVQYDSLPNNTSSNLGTHTCDCMAGIEEENSAKRVSIFPSPSANTKEITVTSNDMMEEIIVFNIEGQKMYSAKCRNRTAIIPSHFSSGIYLAEIRLFDGKIIHKKFSVN